jgi:hypothetical protein
VAVIDPVNAGVGANPTERVKIDVVELKPGAAGVLMVMTQSPGEPAVKKKLFWLLLGNGEQPDPADPSKVIGNVAVVEYPKLLPLAMAVPSPVQLDPTGRVEPAAVLQHSA